MMNEPENSPTSVLLALMERIETHPPIVELLKKEDMDPLYLTDDAFLPGDATFAGMIERWGYLADMYLIKEDGTPDMRRLTLLEQKGGYQTGPGEQDGFGWLTGKIRKGRLVYVFG